MNGYFERFYLYKYLNPNRANITLLQLNHRSFRLWLQEEKQEENGEGEWNMKQFTQAMERHKDWHVNLIH